MKSKYGFALLVVIAAMLAGILYFNHTARETPQTHAQSNASTPATAMPACPDSAGNHLNWSSGAMVCGTSSAPITWLTGTTSNIGGSLLLAGACATGTVTVAGATVGSPITVSPSDGTNIAGLGVDISAVVTSTNTVTVNLCALLSVTPAAKTYVVKVIQ